MASCAATYGLGNGLRSGGIGLSCGERSGSSLPDSEGERCAARRGLAFDVPGTECVALAKGSAGTAYTCAWGCGVLNLAIGGRAGGVCETGVAGTGLSGARTTAGDCGAGFGGGGRAALGGRGDIGEGRGGAMVGTCCCCW